MYVGRSVGYWMDGWVGGYITFTLGRQLGR